MGWRNRIRRKLVLAAGGMAVVQLITARPAGGEETVLTKALLSIPRLSQLVISGDLSDLLTISPDAGGELSYEDGYVESAVDGTVLNISTNAAWDLSAKLSGDWSCPGVYDKDENDLLVRIANTPIGTIQNGAGDYIRLVGTDTVILTHDSPVADNEVDVQTKILLDWAADVPGSYSITLTYTLVAHVP